MKKTAIITPNRSYFNMWIFDKCLDSDEYIMVNRIEHIRGAEFNDVILGYHHDKVNADVIEKAKLRIR